MLSHNTLLLPSRIATYWHLCITVEWKSFVWGERCNFSRKNMGSQVFHSDSKTMIIIQWEQAPSGLPSAPASKGRFRLETWTEMEVGPRFLCLCIAGISFPGFSHPCAHKYLCCIMYRTPDNGSWACLFLSEWPLLNGAIRSVRTQKITSSK